MLLTAGWNVGAGKASTAEVGKEIKVLHQPTQSGTGSADYILWGDNGKPVGVIEAKKTAEDAQKGKMQVKYYADDLEKMHGQRPVIFFTNGYDVFIWDDAKTEPPRKLFGFYSKESLEYALFQTQQREPVLGALNPKEFITDRLYQIEAIKRVAETFDMRKRCALVIQATGTGKTRVAIALCELMTRAKWATVHHPPHRRNRWDLPRFRPGRCAPRSPPEPQRSRRLISPFKKDNIGKHSPL